MNSLPSTCKVYPSLLTKGFVDQLYKQGNKIKTVSDALDVMKWQLAEMVNLEWRDGDYKGEVKKIDFLAACSQCLPVMLFGHSGETLKRWCGIEEYYEKVPQAKTLLKGSSFDHLLRAKRLADGEKVKNDNGDPAPAEYAVAKAIAEKWTAERMQMEYDPTSDGETQERTIQRLYGLSEMMWMPKRAAELIREAVEIIKESRKENERTDNKKPF